MLTLSIFRQNLHQQRTFACQWIRVTGELDPSSERWTESNASQDGTGVVVSIPHESPEKLNFECRLIEAPGCGASNAVSVELINRGRSLALSSGPRIHRGRRVELSLPFSFRVGEVQVQLTDQRASHPVDEGLTSVARALSGNQESQRVSPGPETLAAWLETLSDLQKMAAGTKGLFETAAQAAFNPGGLDGCMILTRASAEEASSGDGGAGANECEPVPPVSNCNWRIEASHIPYPDHGIHFREDLVQVAFESRETFYHEAGIVDRDAKFVNESSTTDLHTAVICPVVDADDQVAAVVYGFRSLHRRNLRKGIRLLEAQFIQVVADSLSAGMIRLNSEAEAARSQVLLEQAFTPKIARTLQAGLNALKPRKQEVTVLFADLRGFSSIAEEQGTETTFDLLSDVMDEFSHAVNDLDGVIIDFYGDGISAFWNAPIPQPQHAVLACQAAVEILECMPKLNRKWRSLLGRELQVGVGIHTGVASVGNSGSRTRLKYGPRGMAVNMASRLEALTKSLDASILVSGETAERVQGVFETKLLQTMSLAGHQAEIDVFGLANADGSFLPPIDVSSEKPSSMSNK